MILTSVPNSGVPSVSFRSRRMSSSRYRWWANASLRAADVWASRPETVLPEVTASRTGRTLADWQDVGGHARDAAGAVPGPAEHRQAQDHVADAGAAVLEHR